MAVRGEKKTKGKKKEKKDTIIPDCLGLPPQAITQRVCLGTAKKGRREKGKKRREGTGMSSTYTLSGRIIYYNPLGKGRKEKRKKEKKKGKGRGGGTLKPNG